jgi:hypothetical protein
MPRQATTQWTCRRSATGIKNRNYKKGSGLTRAELTKTPVLKKAFDDAKLQMRTMGCRCVEEKEPTRQALLEIYCATVPHQAQRLRQPLSRASGAYRSGIVIMDRRRAIRVKLKHFARNRAVSALRHSCVRSRQTNAGLSLKNASNINNITVSGFIPSGAPIPYSSANTCRCCGLSRDDLF